MNLTRFRNPLCNKAGYCSILNGSELLNQTELTVQFRIIPSFGVLLKYCSFELQNRVAFKNSKIFFFTFIFQKIQISNKYFFLFFIFFLEIQKSQKYFLNFLFRITKTNENIFLSRFTRKFIQNQNDIRN